MNLQVAEKQIHNIGTFQVNSIWNTIQGEGPCAGAPALFIRMAGCNLQCEFCDTLYTERTHYDLDALMMKIDSLKQKFHPYLAVITGGEPLRQYIEPLIRELLSCRWTVQIETNGTIYQPGLENCIVVCSPKTPKLDKNILPMINYYKYVVADGMVSSEDGLPTSCMGEQGIKEIARPPVWFDTKQIFVQPLWEDDLMANRRHVEAAVQSCMKYGYRLSLQLHKIAGVP